MILNKNAQSTIEYTAIAILVMVGILLMGPYIIRAVNSHFKGLEDQIEDSMEEDFEQSPPMNLDLPGCDCTPLQFCRCGTGDVGDCGQQEELWCVTCDPPGCGLELEECRPNPQVNWPITDKCCTDWTCNNVPGDCPLCPPEEGIQERFCGEENEFETQCDICPLCSFQCLGGADFCANEVACGDNPPSLMDTPWSHVDFGACNDPFPECEAECPDHLVAGPSGCECPGNLIKNGVCGCDCPSDQIAQNIHIQCAAGRCGSEAATDFGSISMFQSWCPPDYVLQDDPNNDCLWDDLKSGGDAPTWFWRGPAANGAGWQCAGRPGYTDGSTCHNFQFTARSMCAYDCPDPIPGPGPQGISIYQTPPGCGNTLTPHDFCWTEGCDWIDIGGNEGVIYKDCGGTCQAGGQQTCNVVNKVGELSYGLLPAERNDVYIRGPGCLWDDWAVSCLNWLTGGPLQPFGTRIQLTPDATCLTDESYRFPNGTSWYYDCNGASTSNDIQLTCNNMQVGHLFITQQNPDDIEIFREPLGCGGDLTNNGSGCETILCGGSGDTDYHFDCAGVTCDDKGGPLNCSSAWMVSYGWLPKTYRRP